MCVCVWGGGGGGAEWGSRAYAASQTTVLHMKKLNQTESPIIVILCGLCFQRYSFLTFFVQSLFLHFSYDMSSSIRLKIIKKKKKKNTSH